MPDTLQRLTLLESIIGAVNLGAIVARGERGALLLSMDGLYRLSANPFYPYMMDKIAAHIGKIDEPTSPKAQALGGGTTAPGASSLPAILQDDKPSLAP